VTSAEGPVTVRLTEVEAYQGQGDPASHAARGPTPRNAVMFGPPGHLYVYFSYGMHWCANVVCHPAGTAGGVLLRAGEVVEGSDLATLRRPAARSPRDLARGPARLTRVLGVTGEDGGSDLVSRTGRITLRLGVPEAVVCAGPRVGISSATDVPWRFWEQGAPSVSPYRPGRPRRTGTGTPTPAPAAAGTSTGDGTAQQSAGGRRPD